MDALECIHTRRSVRQFTSEPVSQEDIRQLLEAAMTAPSACKQLPWEFVVVTDRALLDQAKSVNQYAGMASKAPLAILVCADPTREEHCPGYWIQDCAAATENLLLAARALGLGAVWTAAFPQEDRMDGYRRLFKLPNHIMPVSFVVIGHPAVEQTRQDRFRPDRVHANAW